MRLLRRYRVGLVLSGLAVLVPVRAAYGLTDQPARAVTQPRPDVLLSTVLPLILISTLYGIREERFPRRVGVPDAEMAPLGDRA